MLVSEFDYELPEELIAQRPPEVRGTSRTHALAGEIDRRVRPARRVIGGALKAFAAGNGG